MLVGSTAWFFVGGDSPTELQRLDRALQILLTVHAMRVAGHIVTEICMFQMITGITVVWPLTGWTQSSSSLMTAFVEARVAFASSVASSLASSGLASGAATGLAGPPTTSHCPCP